MEIKDVDARLQRLTETLTHLLEGDFAAAGVYNQVEDDPLGRVEQTVRLVVGNIESMTVANREKEASLLLQQEQLVAKTELLDLQRQNISEQEQELQLKTATIERQAVAISELSTPVLEVWDDVLVLPIIGTLDTHRSAQVMTNLLDTIIEKQAAWVIIDVTGVEVVDTRTADHLIQMVSAARLLGTSCLLCGLQPAVAQTLVDIGVDLAQITTKRNLRQALSHCVQRPRQ